MVISCYDLKTCVAMGGTTFMLGGKAFQVPQYSRYGPNYYVTFTKVMRNTQELTSAFMHCPYPIVTSTFPFVTSREVAMIYVCLICPIRIISPDVFAGLSLPVRLRIDGNNGDSLCLCSNPKRVKQFCAFRQPEHILPR
ncbi:hypothetical protein As57867_020421, partial [Aphanomyces stellatus]